MDLLKGLNNKQIEAVTTPQGPVLVNAGAGSGKTKVLAHRIAYLVSRGIQPNHILALTFTNKAANEMKERIRRLLATSYKENPWIGTFHSLAAYILRIEHKAAGLERNFVIFDEKDSKTILKTVITQLEFDPTQIQVNHIKTTISRFQTELVTPDDFIGANNHPFAKKLYAVWTRYEKKMKEMNGIDFDYLLTYLVRLFEKNPEILKKYQDRWRSIHIDEYQDTNYPQYLIAKSLSHCKEPATQPDIFVVGDVDQAIYSWRGADFRNMLKFELDFPKATIVTLEENYRSTPIILDAANAVIEQNKARIPKTLRATKSGGARIEYIPAENEQEEALHVAEEIQTLAREGVELAEIAVMYRTNAQSRILEETLLRYAIPYRVAGTGFYARKEIKDMIAYARLALNPRDEISYKRIFKKPSPKKNKFIEEIRNHIKINSTSSSLEYIAQRSGVEKLKDSDEERWLNVKELVALSKKFDNEPAPQGTMLFLEEIALISQTDMTNKKKNAVQLLTVHAAKGLEFKIVFVTGLEEGLFPFKSFNDAHSERSKEEEERRLFYVALTRAQERLFLSFARSRALFGEKIANDPSSFLNDIPHHLMRHTGNDDIITIEFDES